MNDAHKVTEYEHVHLLLSQELFRYLTIDKIPQQKLLSKIKKKETGRKPPSP